MPTPYEKIYGRILAKLESYEIPKMDESEAREYLYDFLIFAIASFYLCEKDLSDRDDELEQFNVELSIEEIEILSNYAAIEYVDSTYIRTPNLLRVNNSSTDFHAFSNANHIKELTAMNDYYLKKNETFLSRYGWKCEAMNKTMFPSENINKRKHMK